MSEADPELGPQDGAHRAYYAEARSWAADAQAARDRSRRFAWGVAAAAVTIAVLEALALIALAPLKTVVPYTLLVDRNTGFVEALDPAHPLPLQPQAALTQSLLAQYVVARETFDIAGLAEQYQKVALWSAEAARRDYLSMMTSGNPDNPLTRYPRSTVVQTHVESVSPVAADTALVRFYTEQSDPDHGPRPRAYWAAMVRYRYSGEPMTLADRLVNPLGFQVVSYRRDQEAPPPPEAMPVATATPLAVSPPRDNAAPPVATPAPAVPPGEVRPAYPRPAGQATRPGVIQTLR
jgi:type IV secretion system protein VirB8